MSPQTVRLYAFAIGASKIGTGLFFLVNTWVVIDITGSPSSAALSLIMTVLPGILLSPFLGVFLDRGHPGRLAVFAEASRAAVLFVYAAACHRHSANAALGYAVSFLVALGSELQVMAWRSAIARGVGGEQMFRLNALTVVGGQTGQILGAAASGFALAALGASATVLLTGVAFLGAALLGLVVAQRMDRTASVASYVAASGPSSAASSASASVPVPRTSGLRSYADELLAGFAHLKQRPTIAFYYSLIIANLSVIFGINGMLAPFVRDELGLGPEAFGKIDAAYAFGAIAGGLLVVRMSRRYGKRAVLLSSFVLACASLWTFAHATGLLTSIVSYIGLGLAFQANVISLSAAQEAAHPNFQGRVNAAFSTVSGLVGLTLYGVIAACVEHHWLRPFYSVQAGTMLVLFGLVAAATRHGEIRRLLHPSPQAA